MPEYLFPRGLVMKRGGEEWKIRLLSFPEIIESNPRVQTETHETVREPPKRPLKGRDWEGDENTLRHSSTIDDEAYAAISTLYPADRSTTEYDTDPAVGSYHPESGDLQTDGRSPIRGRMGNEELFGLIENTTETFRKHGIPFDGEVLNIVVRESRENNGEDWQWELSDKQYAVWCSAIYWAQVNAWACSEKSSIGPMCKPISHRPTKWAVENLTDHPREDRAKLSPRRTSDDGGEGGIRIMGLQSTSTHPYRATDLQRRRVADQAIILAGQIVSGDVPVPEDIVIPGADTEQE
jgi:hypothetical protein